MSEYYTIRTKITNVRNDPAYGAYGRLIFPVDPGYYGGSRLGDLSLAWYNYIDPDKTGVMEMENILIQMLHLKSEPVGIYLGNTAAVCVLSILKAVCPECRQRQSWAPKKSLFKKNTKLVKNAADVVEIDWNSEKVDIHK